REVLGGNNRVRNFHTRTSEARHQASVQLELNLSLKRGHREENPPENCAHDCCRRGLPVSQARGTISHSLFPGISTMSMAVETHRLTRYFDKFCAVNGIDLRVESGTFY